VIKMSYTKNEKRAYVLRLKEEAEAKQKKPAKKSKAQEEVPKEEETTE